MRFRDGLAAVAAALAISALASSPALDRLSGLSTDVLFWIRHHTAEPQIAEPSPVAIIAIDEETYRTPPFAGLPKVMWTKQVAAVLDATLAGGARVVGFDVVYPTSVERYVRGFDREFLVALKKAARENRVVLGKVQHSSKPILPHTGYRIVVGRGRNLHVVNLLVDPDGIVRRVPLRFEKSSGGTETAFAMELASRASDGDEVFRSRWSGEEDIMLNFPTTPGAIPIYSFADMFACAEKGDAAFFARHFAGKTVIIGTALDVEDRKLTSRRLITAPVQSSSVPRCALAANSESAQIPTVRETVPGAYVQATAVANLLRGDALQKPGVEIRFAAVLVLGLCAAFLVIGLPLVWASGGAAVGAVVWVALSAGFFSGGTVLPLVEGLIAAAAIFSLMLGYRFTVADRDKRHIRKAFSLYLPSSHLARLVESGQQPELGGEVRDLTLWFSDIAGFTSLSEGMEPQRLVELLNEYFSVVSDVIERHGGVVDKFIGDGVLAIFGAPLPDPDHARHAVQAALECQQRLAAMNTSINTRIGLNTGEALVGNIGSRTRFNYTVMGDAVNVAARLEGANKYYGTEIMVADSTRQAAGGSIVFREIDLVRVVGRGEPIRVFQPLASGSPAIETMAVYEKALSQFRERDFTAAETAFASIADGDALAAYHAQRAGELAQSLPPADWQPVNNLSGK